MANFTAPVTTNTRQGEGTYGGNLVAQSCTFTVSTAPTLNQFVACVPVPKNARIYDVLVAYTDMDSNGTPTLQLSVGDSTTPARFVAAQAIGTGAGVARLNVNTGHNYVYAAEDKIGVAFPAVAATFAAGTITLTVQYVVE